MLGVTPTTSCKQYFRELKILTLPSLYIHSVILYVKNQMTVSRNVSVHNYNTRTKNNIHLPFSRLSVGQNSPMYRGGLCYNKYVNMFECSDNCDTFRRDLSNYLIDNVFYSVDEFLNC